MQQGLAVITDNRAVFNSPQHVALVQKLADTYKVGGLLKESLFAEDNFPAVIDAYKGGRLGMLLAPPTAMQRIRGDAKDIYAITDVAPAPLGASDRLAGRRSRPQAAGCPARSGHGPLARGGPPARGGLARLAGQQGGERFFPVCRPVAALALWGQNAR